jgi:hypothetical protein
VPCDVRPGRDPPALMKGDPDATGIIKATLKQIFA